MNVIFMLLLWLLLAFVVGIAFGKFLAVGSRSDARIPKKMNIESETSIDSVTPQEDSSDEAA
jgi:hypothetical protein